MTPIPPYTPSGGGDVTEAELDAAVAAAVNSLVDGAPAALDTLNELAAAMGDDANLAATISGQITSLDGRVDDLEAAVTTPNFTVSYNEGTDKIEIVSAAPFFGIGDMNPGYLEIIAGGDYYNISEAAEYDIVDSTHATISSGSAWGTPLTSISFRELGSSDPLDYWTGHVAT